MKNKGVILHIIGALVAGGAEKLVVDLLIEMKNQGCDVSLFVLSNRTDPAGISFSKKLDIANIKYSCGPTEKVGIGSLLSMLKTISSIKPAYIHLHTPNTELAYYLVGRFYFSRHLLFRTIHNTTIKYGPFTKRAFIKNNIAKTIACGTATYEAFKNIILDNFFIIKNGVTFDWKIKNRNITKKFKNKLGLTCNQKHYLCIGRMSGDSIQVCQKAQDLLIKSWLGIDMSSKDAVLHLLGTGNLIGDLKKLAANDKSIVFHGVRDDVKSWLLACDCFVMPSRYEGLPIAGIEAIATGVYCIISKIKPLEELEPPYSLWVVKDSEKSLSEALEISLNLNVDIDQEKIKQFRKKYSIEQMAKQYIELYR